MPMSSVRMISETAGAVWRVRGGLAVCADTNVTELADSIQLTQATVRIRRIGGRLPLANGRSQTRNEGLTCPRRRERQDPYSGSPDQATRRGAWSSASGGSEIRRRRAPAAPRGSAPGACDRCATDRCARYAATARAARRCPFPNCRRTRRARCRIRAARGRDSWRASATRPERTPPGRFPSQRSLSWRSNMLCASFPPPDRTILGIDDRTDVYEATLREDARGRIRFRSRVRPNRPHAGLARGEVNQRAGGLGRVSPAFARRHDTIGNLHHSLGIGRAFESRATDDLAARLLDDEEAVTPGIGPLSYGTAQRLEPLGRDVTRNVEPPQSICGGEGDDLLESLRLLDQREQLFRRVREQRQAWRVDLSPGGGRGGGVGSRGGGGGERSRGVVASVFSGLNHVALVLLIVVDADLRRVVRANRPALDLFEEFFGVALRIGLGGGDARQERDPLLRRRLHERLAVHFTRQRLDGLDPRAPALRLLRLERLGEPAVDVHGDTGRA